MTWSQQFDEVVWLDSNGHQNEYSSYEAVLAVDAFSSIQTEYHGAFETLKAYQSVTKDWIFGYLTYDLKNDIEALESGNFDGLTFPELYFFQPKKLFLLKEGGVEVLYLNVVAEEMESDLNAISACDFQKKSAQSSTQPFNIKARIDKDAYLEKVKRMLAHIHRGDIYEANFCQEFYAEHVRLNPWEVYRKLNALSLAPFGCLLKMNERYLLSASPERYLKKMGNKVISQPIKGTARRSSDAAEDEALKHALANNPKERSENIMIVDLVRNDLSQTASRGSVRVEELCKPYTFEQVHQLISTVSSTVSDEVHPVDIIKTSFPMGSMTGAPKISAMRIIEDLEATKRGLYSGAVGYFSPEGDFDFNVVIRSILYNALARYVSYSVGGAITALSVPEAEYEECLVKGKALQVAVGSLQ